MAINRKWIFSQLIAILLVFLIAEIAVRIMGYGPGNLTPNWSNFHPVDSLIVYDHFHTDSSGILIANAAFYQNSTIHINKEGFRAPDFDSLDSTKEKVLLIGDSFTWGLTAEPLDSSFADILKRTRKEQIINTGIPIADPVQYAAIAQKYIPKIKPKKVLVFFYLGNDIMRQDRALVPLKPFYYYTNAGAIMAWDGNHFFPTAKEAYQYYSTRKFFLQKPNGIAEQIIAKSALLSRIYSYKFRLEEKMADEREITELIVTRKYLHTIDSVCKQYNSSLQIILIPELKEADKDPPFFTKRYSAFFQDSIISNCFYLPSGNTSKNYKPYPDGHFNNAGHSFYAKKISELLDKEKRSD